MTTSLYVRMNMTKRHMNKIVNICISMTKKSVITCKGMYQIINTFNNEVFDFKSILHVLVLKIQHE